MLSLVFMAMKVNEVRIMEVSYKGLWKLLIDKDLKKKDLVTKAGISQSSVAKMSRGETISLDILLKICEALECNIGDLVDAVPSKDEQDES